MLPGASELPDPPTPRWGVHARLDLKTGKKRPKSRWVVIHQPKFRSAVHTAFKAQEG